MHDISEKSLGKLGKLEPAYFVTDKFLLLQKFERTSLRDHTIRNLIKSSGLKFHEKMISDFLSLFFPFSCHICDKTMAKGILCSRCAPQKTEQILWPRCKVCYVHLETPYLASSGRCLTCEAAPPPFRQCCYVFEYTEGLRHTLRYTKYHPSYLMAEELCSRALRIILEDKLLKKLSSYDIITVIPPSIKGYLRRDFHLPALFAQTLWNAFDPALHRPQLQKTLKHDWYTTPQAGLKISKRLLNMKGRWSVRRDINGKKILLIDDVMTTGSSIISATKSLLDCGSSSVDILTLTRSPVFDKVRGRILAAL